MGHEGERRGILRCGHVKPARRAVALTLKTGTGWPLASIPFKLYDPRWQSKELACQSI
jgi:hypothetical protein